jgi:Zn-dependent protease with chaperone function
LGIEEPEFYLKMDPQPNAWTYGDTRVFITLTSGLVEALDDEELDAVIAHECGHIICRHTLYRTFENIFWNTMSQNVPKDADGILKLAYLYWARKSELSCDRVAAMITSPDIALRMMARFAGGPKSITSKINMEEWAKQADIYDDLYKNNNLWNKALLLGNTMGLDHPFWAVRVREVLNWCKTEEYLKVKNNLNIIKDPSCERCGKPYQGKPTYCIHCGNKLKNT